MTCPLSPPTGPREVVTMPTAVRLRSLADQACALHSPRAKNRSQVLGNEGEVIQLMAYFPIKFDVAQAQLLSQVWH